MNAFERFISVVRRPIWYLATLNTAIAVSILTLFLMPSILIYFGVGPFSLRNAITYLLSVLGFGLSVFFVTAAYGDQKGGTHYQLPSEYIMQVVVSVFSVFLLWGLLNLFTSWFWLPIWLIAIGIGSGVYLGIDCIHFAGSGISRPVYGGGPKILNVVGGLFDKTPIINRLHLRHQRRMANRTSWLGRVTKFISSLWKQQPPPATATSGSTQATHTQAQNGNTDWSNVDNLSNVIKDLPRVYGTRGQEVADLYRQAEATYREAKSAVTRANNKKLQQDVEVEMEVLRKPNFCDLLVSGNLLQAKELIEEIITELENYEAQATGRSSGPPFITNSPMTYEYEILMQARPHLLPAQAAQAIPAFQKLGISFSAKDEDIKAAKKELSKRYHPDFRTDERDKLEAQARLTEINKYYETLKDALGIN